MAHNRVARSRATRAASARAARESHNRIAANRAHAATSARTANAGREGHDRDREHHLGNGFENARFGGRHWENRGYGRFWAGGVFWPFFFGDYFSYAFWPDDYYDSFWGWSPDTLIWGAFWPAYGYPYADGGFYTSGEAGSYAGDIYAAYRDGSGAPAPEHLSAVSPQEAASACTAFAPGVNDFPVQKIADVIHPTPAQQAVLNELRVAMDKAASILKGSCSAGTPASPVARLDAMEQRLKMMQQAQDVLRGPLERLYGLLSDEQRQKLDAAGKGPNQQPARMDLAKLCSSQAGFTNVPADDIAQTIKLDAQQTQDLESLKRASAEAANVLRASCPQNVPQGLEARLNAAQKRTGALIQAIQIVRPQVQTFFASLSSAEKTALSSRAPVTRKASNR